MAMHRPLSTVIFYLNARVPANTGFPVCPAVALIAGRFPPADSDRTAGQKFIHETRRPVFSKLIEPIWCIRSGKPEISSPVWQMAQPPDLCRSDKL